MGKSFNILQTFPVETTFSFFKELERYGFKRLDEPLKDMPICYKGFLYDYESECDVPVCIELEEGSSSGTFSKYIHIYKGNKDTGRVIYYGLKPESSFVFQLLFTHLLPSKKFIDQYEDLVISREYELISKFDLAHELYLLGFDDQNKSQECQFTNREYSIYFAVDDGVNFDDEGHSTGMVVINSLGKTLYEGKMPNSKDELYEILYGCGIIIAYIR